MVDILSGMKIPESDFLTFSRERARGGGSPILKVSDGRPAAARIPQTRITNLRVRA
jgi:hypothetical protein